MISEDDVKKEFVSASEVVASPIREDTQLRPDNSLSQGDEIVLPENIEDLPVKIQDLVINGVHVERNGKPVKYTTVYLRINRRGKEIFKEVSANIFTRRVLDAKTNTFRSMECEPVQDILNWGCEYVLDVWKCLIEHGVRSIKVTSVEVLDVATWENDLWNCERTRKSRLYTFAYGCIDQG